MRLYNVRSRVSFLYLRAGVHIFPWNKTVRVSTLPLKQLHQHPFLIGRIVWHIFEDPIIAFIIIIIMNNTQAQTCINM